VSTARKPAPGGRAMPDSKPPAWQAWVAEQLYVADEAPLAETRRAILARLEAAELVPPEQLRAAVQLGLAGQQSGGPPARAIATFAKANREELAEAVEQFAQRFWSLAPAKREARHAELMAAAASAPLIRLRLQGLRAGLRVAAIDNADGDPVADLAVRVQECFVLPPTDRAVQRQELARSLLSDTSDSPALGRLLNSYPQLIRLEPNLTAVSLATPVKMKLRRLRRYDDVVPGGNNNLSRWKVGGVWWLVFMGFMSLLRIAATSNGPGNYSQPYQPLPNYEITGDDIRQITPAPDTNKPVKPIEPASQRKLMDPLFRELKKSSEKAAKSTEKVNKGTAGSHRPSDQGKRSGDGNDSSRSDSPPTMRP
jgi:hypothetical protein